MNTFVLLAFYVDYFSSAVTAICLRVVGGNPTTIDEYPSATAVLWIAQPSPMLICGGTLLSKRHILTAAHCFMVRASMNDNPEKYLIRVGSTFADRGGIIYSIDSIIIHPEWNMETIDSDVAIMRTANIIAYTSTVQPANIAGTTYRLRDNESIWAVGWGLTAENGHVSEQLRHVKVFTINDDICRSRYRHKTMVSDNMFCSGWLGVGGRDHCTRDSGSPLYHKNVVVGMSSKGLGCGRPCYPGINVKISRFTDWIQKRTKPESNDYYQILNHKPSSPSSYFDWASFLDWFQ